MSERAKVQRDDSREQGLRLLQIAKGVSATLGSDFFRSLAKHLASAFEADCIYIGELAGVSGRRIRTLVVYQFGEESENFEQDLSGTATGHVIAEGAFACGRDATKLFPLDMLLDQMHAEAYVGTRLSDSSGKALGLLAMIGSRRHDIRLEKSVLEIFAPRAAGELERKQADDQRRESEERHRAFISSNPDAMWRIELEQPVPIDLDEQQQIERIYRFGYLAECNDAMARLAGAESADRLVGVRFGKIVPQNDSRMQEELLLAVRSGFRNTAVETSLLDEAGRRRYRLRSHFGIVENGELRRIWGVIRDITELRRTELSLQASERRFHQVLESVQLPCVILDAGGRITFCNDFLLNLTGRLKEEVEGSNWLETIVLAEERDVWKMACLGQSTGQPSPSHHFEGTLLAGPGGRRRIAWDTVVLHEEHEEVRGLAAIGRDITDQRELEAQIRQAQKLEVIRRLAGGVAHDFNSLLTMLIGHTALLLDGKVESHPDYESLAAIRDTIQRCAGLTQQLLAIGRQQIVHPQTTSMNALILAEEGSIRSLAGKDIQLTIELNPALTPIYADPTHIHRVLLNLVTNARDATPRGGKLMIATSNVEIRQGDTNYPSDITPGTYARLSVADTGVGLSEEVRAHLFEPFVTTKEPGKGTGLGLSTVYGIVTQNGGHIVVHSVPAGGTTFEILLPAATPGSDARTHAPVS